MATASTQASSTEMQRRRIRHAMRVARLPLAHITELHTPALQRAGIRAEYGTPLTRLLRGIGYSAAARLLDALRTATAQEAPHARPE
ncbi:hypothetical protein CSC62_13960 [Pseudoxanthomonas jiangsuensis]|uniref:hypothetical protein n=1 Tax=Pseudoxanthomonas jiangsuensis TaxID=619688 RepID=UPI001390BFB2|nr:hypothetical protein [Pseudoxanthomonas jiangsuensis]KAF1692735.1 hypothetical protein CSC62_13960 [Pseudoxanthomonas jiangsuensis]